MLMKRTKRPNQYSLKKIAELNAEAPMRIKLADRAHGIPHETIQVVHHNSTKHTIRRVTCINGQCECSKIDPEGCNYQFSHRLEPHHLKKRSQGGLFTKKNIIMVRHACHERMGGSNVQLNWIKEDE